MDKRMLKRIVRIVCVFICFGLISIFSLKGNPDHSCFGVGPVYAQDDWRKEFEDVCSRTQDAMVISSDELKNLVDRCDVLKPRIEKLDESQRKVFLKRLQLCRDLYFFVLESREKKQ